MKNSTVNRDDPRWKHHQFLTTAVSELSTGRRYQAPLVAFKLNRTPDDEFFGFRDSSGSALHQSRELALQGSRDEFCERQALSLFWYFGHCKGCIDLRESEFLAELESKFRFLTPLLLTGRIFLYDISLFSPVRSVLCVYLSDVGDVRFAAGASGSPDIAEAVEKALLEMYQAYILMANITDGRVCDLVEINDPIIRGYLTNNGQETVNEFVRLFDNHYSGMKNFPASIDFKMNFEQEPVILYMEVIRFTDKEIYLSVTKSLYGFRTMSLDEEFSSANSAAARRYGYYEQINSGPVPFA